MCHVVRARDVQCVVSAHHPDDDCKDGVKTDCIVTHIFPPCHQKNWNYYDMDDMMPESPEDMINSAKNGILLSREMHVLFNHYAFSIDPDVRVFFLFFGGVFLVFFVFFVFCFCFFFFVFLVYSSWSIVTKPFLCRTTSA